jgi:hypothetical protein
MFASIPDAVDQRTFERSLTRHFGRENLLTPIAAVRFPTDRYMLRRTQLGRAVMVFTAVIVAVIGVILKLIAVDPAGWFLAPLAGVAGVYHVFTHAAAARAPEPPLRLALISDVLLFAAILLQIDFGSWNCGHTTFDAVTWRLGWDSEYRCTLIRGFPAIALDVLYYVPVAATWARLRQVAAASAGE